MNASEAVNLFVRKFDHVSSDVRSTYECLNVADLLEPPAMLAALLTDI